MSRMDFINSSCGRCLSAFFQDRAPPEKGQKFWFHPADISQTCSQVSKEGSRMVSPDTA